MSYIGLQPQVGSYSKLDNLAPLFNGSTTTFTLQVGGSPVIAGSPQNLLISINGVLQEPGISYSVLNNQIIFAVPPPSGATFFGVRLGHVMNLGIPSDSSITAAKLNAADAANFRAVIGGGAQGNGGDAIFHLNGQVVTSSYTVPVGMNASSTGPITINDGVTVTIPDGSRWVVD